MIKEVSIAMTPTEEKAITRLQTRRRRLRKQTGGAGAHDVPSEMEAPEATEPMKTANTVNAVQKIESASMPTAPVLESIVHSPVTAIEQSVQTGGKVQISTHKKHQTGSTVSTGVSKILPTKRHMTVKRKHTVVVGKQKGGNETPMQQQQPAPEPVQQQSPAPPALEQPQQTAPTSTPAQVAGARKKHRRFTERRMSITVKNAKATRKSKKLIRKKVKAMGLETIRKTLLEKGILTAKSNPPEKMLRSMMKEYLLLQEQV